jgi:hypothetical protein
VTASDLIRIIGVSHLLQPPLTLVLAGPRGIDLRAQLVSTTALAGEVMTNMAAASVLLPTTLGILLACYPTLALESGPARALAVLISTFWCWRLYRQVFVLGPLWPRAAGRGSWLNALLTLIFLVQGPALGLLLCFR